MNDLAVKDDKEVVLITGANGQLGREFQYLNSIGAGQTLNFIFVSRSQLDIKNKQQVSDFCNENKITVIVNCAAYTAVDKAEQEEGEAVEVNDFAVEHLAQVAKNKNIKLIHISTDYVFDGTSHRPYRESDGVQPQSVYGKTKLSGELAMQEINPRNSIIIRTAWVYSEFGNNFVKTMKRLGRERNEISVVCDQIGSPTNARDLAEAIIEIIPLLKDEGVEIYHYTNHGVCSWYDLALAVFEVNEIECKVNPISTDAYPTPAKRPFYSVMNKSKIVEKFGIDIRHWRESLQ